LIILILFTAVKDPTPVRREMARHAKKEPFSGIDEDLHDMETFKFIKSSRGRKRNLKNNDKENDFVTSLTGGKKIKTKFATKSALLESK
jgi:hypothetical protein